MRLAKVSTRQQELAYRSGVTICSFSCKVKNFLYASQLASPTSLHPCFKTFS